MTCRSHIIPALGLALAALLLPACEKSLEDNPCASGASISATSSRAQDDALLQTLYDELIQKSGSQLCAPADTWRITPYGAMACGGPAGYLAYRVGIDEACFLKKVAHFTQQQQQYNGKYGIISPCVIMPMPKGVNCVEGKIVLVY